MNEPIFIEAKVNNKNIEKIIQSAGIQYPHESLGFFRSVYASIAGDANKNGVRLAESVEKDVPLLVGCQVNFEHNRVGNICGTILYAYVNKNKEIEIVFSFYKSVYPKQYEMAVELMNKGELNVSFELKVDKDDIVEMADGTRLLKKVSFDGVGLLMFNNPAYPNAHVYENAIFDQLREQDLVFAKCFQPKIIIQQFEGSHWTAKYINQLPDSCFAVIEPSYLEGKISDKRARHLPYKDHEGNINLAHYRFAMRSIDKLVPITDSITNEELIMKAQDVLNTVNISVQNEEDSQVDKKANDALLAKLKESVVAEFGEEAVKDWKDEDYTEEKINAYRESLKVAKPAEEAKVEVPAEEVKPAEEAKEEKPAEEIPAEEAKIEEAPKEEEVKPAEVAKETSKEEKDEVKSAEEIAQTKETTKQTRIYDVVYNDDGSMDVVETITEENEVDGKVVKTEKIVRNTVYMANKIDAIKAEYEAKIAEKDAEIEKVKASAKIVAELKAELGDYVKELSDDDLLNEDKVKIARLTKELDVVKANKVEPVVEVASEVKENKKIEIKAVASKTEDDGSDVTTYIKKQYAKKVKK